MESTEIASSKASEDSRLGSAMHSAKGGEGVGGDWGKLVVTKLETHHERGGRHAAVLTQKLAVIGLQA